MRRAIGLALVIALVAGTPGNIALAATLEITDPPQGSTVIGELLIVTGMAPPDVRVVQDISFAPDQDTTSDSTGLWSMIVDLEEGENVLTFRIADDHSTEQVLVVHSLPSS